MRCPARSSRGLQPGRSYRITIVYWFVSLRHSPLVSPQRMNKTSFSGFAFDLCGDFGLLGLSFQAQIRIKNSPRPRSREFLLFCANPVASSSPCPPACPRVLDLPCLGFAFLSHGFLRAPVPVVFGYGFATLASVVNLSLLVADVDQCPQLQGFML